MDTVSSAEATPGDGPAPPLLRTSAGSSIALRGEDDLRGAPQERSLGSPAPVVVLYRPTLTGCYRLARDARSGGFLYSQYVSDRLATLLAAVALKWRLHPTVLSVANLFVALLGSYFVFAGARDRALSTSVIAGAALWQIAYLFDCADGQVARASNKSTPYGARLDTLVDVAGLTALLVAVAQVASHWSHPPLALLIAVPGVSCINFVTYLFAKQEGSAVGIVRSRSLLTNLIRTLRDHGLVLLVIGAWAAVSPTTLIVPFFAWGFINAATLAAYIATDTFRSVQYTSAGNAGPDPLGDSPQGGS